jgi:hypothetical protein
MENIRQFNALQPDLKAVSAGPDPLPVSGAA